MNLLKKLQQIIIFIIICSNNYMSNEKDNKTGSRKLFLVTSLNKKYPSSSMEIAIPVSYREKLLRIREHQLNKIKQEISVIVQNQIRASAKNSISIDFPRMSVNFSQQSPKMSRPNNQKVKSRRKAFHNQGGSNPSKLVEEMSLQINSWGEQLTAISKKIQIKERPEKNSETMMLPKIDVTQKTNAKFSRFDFFDNKIEPWRYKQEDFKGFHE